MRWFLLIVVTLLTQVLTFSAQATSYFYQGDPLTGMKPSPECLFSCAFNASGLTATLSFAADTSTFTGTLTLSSGDTASLMGSFIVPNALPVAPTLNYPSNNPPVGTTGFVNFLSGSFVFVDGSITSWSLGGNVFLQNCGGGPGCAADGFGFFTSNTGDSIGQSDQFGFPWSATNNEGGVWTGIAAVPEPSTWAMMLIGFAGIGFISWRSNMMHNATA